MPDLYQPFSENVIFYDAEFTSLNPYEGEILSVGMVKMSGETLYVEVEYAGEVHEWVKNRVLPYLQGRAVSREEAVRQIREFMGEKKPYLVSYVNQYDAVFLYKLFGVQNNTRDEVPQHWIPIDFASIAFGYGVNPEKFRHDNFPFMEKLGVNIEASQKHFALDDALILKKIYFRFFEVLREGREI